MTRTTTAAHGTLLTLGAVARLSGVQRPVVSMWRTRSSGSAHPFPREVAQRDGQPRFDRDEVVRWLDATGRTRAHGLAGDADAHVSPAEGTSLDKGDLAAGLLSLLCLRSVLDVELSTLPDIITAARDVDPDDAFLAREIVGVVSGEPALVRHADAFAEAAYGARAAFESIIARPERHGLVDRAKERLAPAAHALLAALATGVAVRAPTPSASSTRRGRARSCSSAR